MSAQKSPYFLIANIFIIAIIIIVNTIATFDPLAKTSLKTD